MLCWVVVVLWSWVVSCCVFLCVCAVFSLQSCSTSLTPVSQVHCLQCVCSLCALRMQSRSGTDSFSFHTGRVCSPLLIRGCLSQTCIHYFDLKSKRCYWKLFFSIVILYHNMVIQYFRHLSDINKYKQCIIQCIWLLDLCIKLLKQVATHLNAAYSLLFLS